MDIMGECSNDFKLWCTDSKVNLSGLSFMAVQKYIPGKKFFDEILTQAIYDLTQVTNSKQAEYLKK